MWVDSIQIAKQQKAAAKMEDDWEAIPKLYSQNHASSNPPPRARPSIAATEGFLPPERWNEIQNQNRIHRQMSCKENFKRNRTFYSVSKKVYWYQTRTCLLCIWQWRIRKWVQIHLLKQKTLKKNIRKIPQAIPLGEASSFLRITGSALTQSKKTKQTS